MHYCEYRDAFGTITGGGQGKKEGKSTEESKKNVIHTKEEGTVLFECSNDDWDFFEDVVNKRLLNTDEGSTGRLCLLLTCINTALLIYVVSKER